MKERQREAEVLEVLRRREEGKEGVAGEGKEAERYEFVEDYDAVLRWHCRL